MIEFEHFCVEDGKVVLSPFPYGRKSKSLFALSEYDAKARRAIVVKGTQRGNPMVLTPKLARREP